MTKREIKLSAEFKAQTTRSIISITFFAFTYILMLTLALGLTALCVYAGIMIIAIRPMFVTIALGAGLASLGAFVLIFLLKFIFRSVKVDRSHLTEISKTEEPELFSLIYYIVKEVGTSFPKKVYLSTDVNASVFYDSGFWSMFLPIKKNLLIGVGLVNSVSKSELTAILSHEFGHFSQRTMKVGSFVYNVNQIIFNLLYDNESYDKLIRDWANINGFFSIFGAIAVKIIEGIQWVLKKMYGIVNRSYMGLSREMEFHADEIAANITGYEPLKSSLLRLSLADSSFDYVLSYYDGKIATSQKSENLFREHLFVMNNLAKGNNIKIFNNLPLVTTEDLSRFNKSKLIIKDQWASHPSIEDRIKMLEKTNLLTEHVDHTPAGKIFSNFEKTQKELTQKIFKAVQYQSEPKFIPFEEFKEEYSKKNSDNTFPLIYNSYYDYKNPLQFDTNTETPLDEILKTEDLFSDQKVDMVYTSIALRRDIETLKQIADKTIPVKTFDYDGQKYKQIHCKELLNRLSQESEQLEEKILQNDINIFRFFKKCEQINNLTTSISDLYKEYFVYDKEFDSGYGIFSNLSSELQFVSVITPFEQIRANFKKIEPIEAELKNGITKLLGDKIIQTEITKEIKDNFELYIFQNPKYFSDDKYLDDNLDILYTAMNNYSFLLSRRCFVIKKNLLNYQAELLEIANRLRSSDFSTIEELS